jgi:sugar phosphate isomerase/epimerase
VAVCSAHGRLAEAAASQLDFERSARDARRNHLAALLKMLRIMVSYLPRDPNKGEAVRDVAAWEDSDLENLQRLASEVGQQAGQRAAVICASLRWLDDRVREVKAIDRRIGFDWKRFPWERWQEELGRATEHLEALWDELLEVPQRRSVIPR